MCIVYPSLECAEVSEKDLSARIVLIGDLDYAALT